MNRNSVTKPEQVRENLPLISLREILQTHKYLPFSIFLQLNYAGIYRQNIAEKLNSKVRIKLIKCPDLNLASPSGCPLLYAMIRLPTILKHLRWTLNQQMFCKFHFHCYFPLIMTKLNNFQCMQLAMLLERMNQHITTVKISNLESWGLLSSCSSLTICNPKIYDLLCHNWSSDTTRTPEQGSIFFCSYDSSLP